MISHNFYFLDGNNFKIQVKRILAKQSHITKTAFSLIMGFYMSNSFEE